MEKYLFTNLLCISLFGTIFLGCGTINKGGMKIKIEDTEIKVETSTKRLPSDVKRVYIPEFFNKVAGQVGIEGRFRFIVKEEFIRDGRLTVVDNELLADARLHVEIDKYILEPSHYDENFVVDQYKLWVLVNVALYEREKEETGLIWSKKPLWEEKSLEGSYNYYIPTRPGGMTETEAQEIIWRKLARDILIRTVEGFGSVSGASQRKIPK